MASHLGHLGIDFGASTTFVAAGSPAGDTRILRDGDGNEFTPSVVAFTPTGAVRVGRAARARRLIDPQNAVYSFKRIMGRPTFSGEVRAFRRSYPFEIVEAEDHTPRFVTRAGELTPVQVATYLFQYLHTFPEVQRTPRTRVCLTVPAAYDEQSRRAISEAAARGGFDDISLLDEPQAAAAAYFAQRQSNQTVAIYDLGGGTFDLAVLRSSDAGLDLLAADGDPYLGGDDIDTALADWAADQILRSFRWDVRTSPASFQVLLYLVESAKIALSRTDEVVVNLSRVDSALADESLTIDRLTLESLAADVVQRTFVACDATLSKAGVQPADIDTVILVGGGSCMPAVHDAVYRYFGTVPVVSTAPDRIVARGAALHAAGADRGPVRSQFARSAPGGADETSEPSARVLVVEDDDTVRNLIGQILEIDGFVVDTAIDGLRAFECIERTRPDLVVADINMPNATGFELVQGLRNLETTHDIPVIFVTAYATGANIAKSVSLNVKTLIAKPFSTEELIEAVRGVVAAAPPHA